jgi:multiple sugar transport system substrate-binding protein
MVSESTENQDAVVAFLDYWNSRESQLFFSQETGFPPSRIDLSDDPALFEASEWAAKFAAVVPDARFFLGGEVNFAQIDNDVFVPMIQSITQGVSEPAEAAQEANEKLLELLGDE